MKSSDTGAVSVRNSMQRLLCASMVRGAVGAITAVMCIGGAARAQSPILDINNASLVTYLPSAASGIQGIRPLQNAGQRGVNLDGSARMMSAYSWALNGNPYEPGVGGDRMSDLRLATGTYSPTLVDLSLPAPGFTVPIGRTYNARQETNAPAHRDSDGPQGKNWQQIAAPEIVLYDADSNSGTKGSDDVLYIVYGADRFAEFRRTATNSDTFRATNGGTGVVVFAANSTGQPETYTYYDSVGHQTVFLGFDGDAGSAAGQFWKMSDAAGNTAYVGSSTLSSTTASTGYDGSGRMTALYDTADRRYTFTYSTIDSVGRLTQVKAETRSGGTWASPSGVVEVGKVDYAYYQTGDNTYGDNGNLKLVTITTPLTDSGVSLARKTYYRYWKGTYDGTTNPGYPNTIQYVVDAEGYRKADWSDTTFNDTPQTMSESLLKPYAAASMEYDSSYRVRKAWFNGECGCSGGNNGSYQFAYATGAGGSSLAGYDATSNVADWRSRTVITKPDGSYETHYFDEVGQSLSTIITDGDPAAGSPPNRWVTEVVRDGSGLVSEVRTPAANTGYTHSTGAITASSSAGLISVYSRVTATEHTKGFVQHLAHKKGTSGTVYYDRSMFYADDDGSDTPETTVKVTAGGVDVFRPFVRWSDEYTTDETSSATTSVADASNLMGNTAYSSSLAFKTVERKAKAVSTGENGANTTDSSYSYLRQDGTAAFSKAADGILTYTQLTNGQVVKRIQDADTSQTSDFAGADVPSGWSLSSSATPLRLISTYTYDAQGRLDTSTAADGLVSKNYYSKLADGRMVTIAMPRVTSGGSTTYYGPASYSVMNLAGKVEFSGTLAISSSGITTALTGWVDETSSDPITAKLIGTLFRVSTSIYNEPGTRLSEARTYTTIPGSGAGSAGTNYDVTKYAYDDAGRIIRVKDATSTITRTVFDAIGRRKESWIGTYDYGKAGTDSTSVQGDNTVKVSDVVYDSGSANGNGLVTTQTAYVQDSTTDQRVTTYAYDYKNRRVLTTPPLAPFTVVKFDNEGAAIATGQYSSSSGLTSATDPTSTTSNRVALSESFYDARRQVWKATRHKINQGTGADEDTLDDLMWYDAVGRTIKTTGENLSKTKYDRLGRATNRYTLAKHDDTVYADASTVTGDTVLEESQTYYQDSTSLPLMTMQISRFHNDTSTTGALDTDSNLALVDYAGNKIKGRAQISCMWYDALHRQIDSVQLGTNGGSNYDRSSGGNVSAPTRDATHLRTTYSYNDNGTTLDVTDPRAKVSRTLYDDAGRRIASIRNYTGGSTTSATRDNDLYTRFVYTNGLQTKMWVDVDGDGAVDVNAGNNDTTDQETFYHYGVTKGASTPNSKIASNRLLVDVQYPLGSSDKVLYAYNAQGQTIWTKDQDSVEIVNDYDTLGRQTHRRVTAINNANFDDSVLRISTAYLARGGIDTVTQYSSATVGSGTATDQVQYSYDGWGNMTSFNQDVDGIIGAGGRAAFSVDYAFTKATPAGGRSTLRRNTMTLPGSSTVTYGYGTSNGINDTFSRVQKLTISSVDVSTYDYVGSGWVVGTNLPEANVAMNLYDSGSPTAYGRVDQFNRVTSNQWDNGEINRLDLTYDENSNVTSVQDATPTALALTGRDIKYALDNVNRLTDADEGTLSGGSITSGTRREQWTLTTTGNWKNRNLDLNHDASYAGMDELNETNKFRLDNAYEQRDLHSNAVSLIGPVYNNRGDMFDDGRQRYRYDAFGRLVKVTGQIDDLPVIGEYRYNGLGYRIGWHYDANASGDTDGSDPWYYFAYDERWRSVATFRGSDSNPKERFVYHAAGRNGFGGSSYIDLVTLRDRDANTAWTSAADGTLEERRYYIQNWRADVISIIKPSVSGTTRSQVLEWVKYSAYGVPTAISPADYNHDGVVNSSDDTAFYADWLSGNADADLDRSGGAPDASDSGLFSDWYASAGGAGWHKLSTSSVNNRISMYGSNFDVITKIMFDHQSIPTIPMIGTQLSSIARVKRIDPLKPDGGIQPGPPNGPGVGSGDFKPWIDVGGAAWDWTTFPGYNNPADPEHWTYGSCLARATKWCADNGVPFNDPCFKKVMDAYMATCTGTHKDGYTPGSGNQALDESAAGQALAQCRGWSGPGGGPTDDAGRCISNFFASSMLGGVCLASISACAMGFLPGCALAYGSCCSMKSQISDAIDACGGSSNASLGRMKHVLGVICWFGFM